jgi:hypothetical protein
MERQPAGFAQKAGYFFIDGLDANGLLFNETELSNKSLFTVKRTFSIANTFVVELKSCIKVDSLSGFLSLDLSKKLFSRDYPSQ